MNSKKLCCICVLFSLLAGCASESSIDEKKKKAQVTQSNINKNTPQQLTDKDLFGNETTLAVSEEDIQAALDGDEFRVPLNSPVILVQSGNRAPETIMQEEMRKYYTVSTFFGFMSFSFLNVHVILLTIIKSFLIKKTKVVNFATDITIQLTLIFLLIAIVIAPLIAPFVTGYVNANYHPCGNNTGIFPGAIYIKNGMKCNNEYISRKEDSAVK